MSDVTRIENGFHNSVCGRAPDVLERMAGGQGGRGSGHRADAGLGGGVARLAHRASRPNRAAELRDAAGFTGRKVILRWIGTEAELIAEDFDSRLRVVAQLTAICKAERQRGLAGHLTYDVARHNQIARLLAKEEIELCAMESAQ